MASDEPTDEDQSDNFGDSQKGLVEMADRPQ